MARANKSDMERFRPLVGDCEWSGMLRNRSSFRILFCVCVDSGYVDQRSGLLIELRFSF